MTNAEKLLEKTVAPLFDETSRDLEELRNYVFSLEGAVRFGTDLNVDMFRHTSLLPFHLLTDYSQTARHETIAKVINEGIHDAILKHIDIAKARDSFESLRGAQSLILSKRLSDCGANYANAWLKPKYYKIVVEAWFQDLLGMNDWHTVNITAVYADHIERVLGGNVT